jgi:hypothetical protein
LASQDQTALRVVRLPERFSPLEEVYRRYFEDKESLRWWTAIEESEKRVGRPGLLVHVADRESDIYDVFKRAHDAGYRILLRAAQDRRVEVEHSTPWAQVASFSPAVSASLQLGQWFGARGAVPSPDAS